MVTKKVIYFLFLCMGINNAIYAQWLGGAASADNIYRQGNIGVGVSSPPPGFASVFISRNLNTGLYFQETAAGVNEKIWTVLTSGGKFRIITQPDDYVSTAPVEAFNISRNSVNVSNVAFPNGNVVIGSSTLDGSYGTDGKVLQIKGVTPWFSMLPSDGSSSMNLVHSAGLGSTMYSRAAHISFWTSPTTSGSLGERMRISTDGNVGIGTATPRGKLDVDGPGDIYLSDDLNAGTSQTLYMPGHIYISPYNGSNISYLQARRLDNSGTTSFRFRTYNNGALSEAMHIEGNGNIGIGTTAPTARLHIAGTSSNYLRIDKSSNSFEAGLQFTKSDGATTTLFYLFSDDTSNALKIQATGLAGEVDATPRMQFPFTNKNIYMAQSGGNVGIGTSAPDQRLSVKGKVHAEEMIIDLSVPAPDYVFEKNYDLPTLAETEKYIQQNKHLPEVPSAKEMEQNGVMVGEMNMLLLKKVEELTLYVIELKKVTEQQQEEINQLKSKRDK